MVSLAFRPLPRYDMVLSKMHSSPFDLCSSGAKRRLEGRVDHLERVRPLGKLDRGGTMKRGSSRQQEHKSERTHDSIASSEAIKPLENDVCLGRGGTANKHSGNEKLRQFARLQAEHYRASSKKGKSAISRLLVKQMRELDPPARYVLVIIGCRLLRVIPQLVVFYAI